MYSTKIIIIRDSTTHLLSKHSQSNTLRQLDSHKEMGAKTVGSGWLKLFLIYVGEKLSKVPLSISFFT